MTAPLRVAVTRDEPADGPLARALVRHGLTPVRCPVVTMAPPADPEPLRRAARGLEAFDWLVVASARAVAALIAARDGRPLPAQLRTAAVGPATAAALVRHGAATPLAPQGAGAGALIEALRAADAWPDRRVLLPRAANGGAELAQALRGFGARVTEGIAYRTLARPDDRIRAAWRAAHADAVVVASPSAARALVRAVGAPALAARDVIAIGGTTAAALAALGVAADQPERAEFECVARRLAAGRGAVARGRA